VKFQGTVSGTALQYTHFACRPIQYDSKTEVEVEQFIISRAETDMYTFVAVVVDI
jgi:hypothetical protein